MALVLNEEQRLLRDSAKGFFADRAPVSAMRALRDEADKDGYSRALWSEMAEMGFAGVLIPETHGGAEFGLVGAGLLCEEMGRTLAATPLLSTAILAATAIGKGGNETQKSDWLPAIAAGEKIVAVAVDESGRHDPTATTMTVTPGDGGFVLNGEKTFVLDGHVADAAIVAGRSQGASGDEDGLSLFLLPTAAEGLSVERITMVDSRNAAKLRFENVRVGNAAVLGSVGDGFGLLDQILDVGRVCLAAEMLGVAREVFERTLGYLQERKQFDALIGSFQSLQHRAAHLFSEIENAEALVLRALQALDAGGDTGSEGDRTKCAILASAAKAKLGEVARLATNEGVQMHGGIGMTDEFDIGLFMKRARAANACFGDVGFHTDRFARLKGY